VQWSRWSRGAYELQWRALYLSVSILIDIGVALMKSSFQAIHLTKDFSFSQVSFFQLVWMVHMGMERAVAEMWTLIKGFEIDGFG